MLSFHPNCGWDADAVYSAAPAQSLPLGAGVSHPNAQIMPIPTEHPTLHANALNGNSGDAMSVDPASSPAALAGSVTLEDELESVKQHMQE